MFFKWFYNSKIQLNIWLHIYAAVVCVSINFKYLISVFSFYRKNVGLIKNVENNYVRCLLNFSFIFLIFRFSDKSFITIGKDIVTEYDIITGELQKKMLQSFIFEEFNI